MAVLASWARSRQPRWWYQVCAVVKCLVADRELSVPETQEDKVVWMDLTWAVAAAGAVCGS